MHANREERHGRYNSWLEEQYDYLTEAHKTRRQRFGTRLEFAFQEYC